ncbi:MAG: hypothetical protein ACJ8FY_24605 [Gemmataceae bacterium]
MKIVKGKTEAEHNAEEQAQVNSNKNSTAKVPQGSKQVSEKDVNDTERALEELEKTKGDFAKDH